MEDWDDLKIGSLIMVGDYNATMSREEYWGTERRSDPMIDFLLSLFDFNHLIDIRPYPLSPIWFNRKSGVALIGKRLDKLCIHENLVEILGVLKSWVVQTHISDHMLIVLQWRRVLVCLGTPFKFNRTQLKDKIPLP